MILNRIEPDFKPVSCIFVAAMEFDNAPSWIPVPCVHVLRALECPVGIIWRCWCAGAGYCNTCIHPRVAASFMRTREPVHWTIGCLDKWTPWSTPHPAALKLLPHAQDGCLRQILLSPECWISAVPGTSTVRTSALNTSTQLYHSKYWST